MMTGLENRPSFESLAGMYFLLCDNTASMYDRQAKKKLFQKQGFGLVYPTFITLPRHTPPNPRPSPLGKCNKIGDQGLLLQDFTSYSIYKYQVHGLVILLVNLECTP